MGTDYTLSGLRFILAPPIHPHLMDEQRSEVRAEVVPKISPAITTNAPKVVLKERHSRSTGAIWGLSAEILSVPGCLSSTSPNPEAILT